MGLLSLLRITLLCGVVQGIRARDALFQHGGGISRLHHRCLNGCGRISPRSSFQASTSPSSLEDRLTPLKVGVLCSSGGALWGLRGGGNVVPNVANLMGMFVRYVGASRTRSWVVLILAICNETGAVTVTKMARDSSDPKKMAIAVGMYICSILGFATSLAKIDLSIAYAVWSALGTAIVTLAGITLFGEKCDLAKVLCLLCILTGVIGLNVRGGSH